MSIDKKIEKYKKALNSCQNELEKYEYILKLGKKVSKLEKKDMISSNIVHGCTSQVWLKIKEKEKRVYLQGFSDSMIVNGLIFIISDIFSNEKTKNLKSIDIDILYELNLSEVITPSKQSGVIGMIKKIEEFIKIIN